MAEQTAQRLRALPSVDRLLKYSRCAALLARYNHDYITQKCREALDHLRAEIMANGKRVANAQTGTRKRDKRVKSGVD